MFQITQIILLISIIIISIIIIILLIPKSTPLNPLINDALESSSLTSSQENFFNAERFNNYDDVRSRIYEYISIYYKSINVRTIEQNINDYADEKLTSNTTTIDITHKKLDTTQNLLHAILKTDNNNIIINNILSMFILYELLYSMSNDDNDMMLISTIGYINNMNYMTNIYNKQNPNNLIYNDFSYYNIDNGMVKIYGPDTPNNKHMDEIKVDTINYLSTSGVPNSNIDCRQKNKCYIELNDVKKEFIKSIKKDKTDEEIKTLIKKALDDILKYIYGLINFLLIFLENYTKLKIDIITFDNYATFIQTFIEFNPKCFTDLDILYTINIQNIRLVKYLSVI